MHWCKHNSKIPAMKFPRINISKEYYCTNSALFSIKIFHEKCEVKIIESDLVSTSLQSNYSSFRAYLGLFSRNKSKQEHRWNNRENLSQLYLMKKNMFVSEQNTWDLNWEFIFRHSKYYNTYSRVSLSDISVKMVQFHWSFYFWGVNWQK